MKAQELLVELRHRGVDLQPTDGRLRVDAPRGSLTEEDRKELSANKDELLDLLERQRPSRAVPSHREVATMSLDEFARAGLIVTVRSEALDCRVLFVSDNVPDEAIEAKGLPAYRVAELRKLAQLRPAPGTIRCLNEIKAIFGGTIEVEDHDD